jgi:hypothetical protein
MAWLPSQVKRPAKGKAKVQVKGHMRGTRGGDQVYVYPYWRVQRRKRKK